MTTKLTPKQLRSNYLGIMSEITLRLEGINDLIDEDKTRVPELVVLESCFLQLRKCCELIALGCLVAHGDIEEVHGKTLSKAWNADEIMKALEQLHPQFFPRAIIFNRMDGNIKDFAPAPPGYLTKAEFLSLYGKCGDRLHSGNLRKVLRRKPVVVDFNEIVDWAQKIYDLLSVHFMLSVTRESGLMCILKDGNNKTTVHAFERAGKRSDLKTATRPQG